MNTRYAVGGLIFLYIFVCYYVVYTHLVLVEVVLRTLPTYIQVTSGKQT